MQISAAISLMLFIFLFIVHSLLCIASLCEHCRVELVSPSIEEKQKKNKLNNRRGNEDKLSEGKKNKKMNGNPNEAPGQAGRLWLNNI